MPSSSLAPLPNIPACRNFALALGSVVSLEELEITGIYAYNGSPGPDAWPDALFPMIANSAKIVTLFISTGISMPDWTPFSRLERVTLTSSAASQPISSLSVFSASSDTLVDLRLGGTITLTDPSSSMSLSNLEHLEFCSPLTSSNYAILSFPDSLTYLQITGWPSSGVTALDVRSPSLRTLFMMSNNNKLTSISKLPLTLLSLTLGDIDVLTWNIDMPAGLESLSYLSIANLPVLPTSLWNCVNLTSFSISNVYVGSVSASFSLLPNFASTSIKEIRLEHLGGQGLPNGVLQDFVCSAPRTTLKTLSLVGSLTWTSLPSCIGEFQSLESLNVAGGANSLVSNLLINVPSSVTSLTMKPHPTTTTTPNWTSLVSQFPNMEHFTILATGSPFGNSTFPGDVLKTWTHLRTLSIPGRHMTGSIPSDMFEEMPNLEILDLSANQLSGTVPSSGWGSLRMLVLYNNLLDHWNDIEAPGAPYLETIVLSSNSLLTIPNDTTLSTMLPNLRVLLIDNNPDLEEFVPIFWAGKHSKLNYISASFTKLGGPLPPITSRHLRRLELGNAALCGPLPEVPSALDISFFIADNNHFSGPIPSSWSNLVARRVSLPNNLLDGTIPELLFNAHASQLTDLNLFDNYFTGTLPRFDQHPNLDVLQLYGNNLTIDWCSAGDRDIPSSTSCGISADACPCLSYYPGCFIAYSTCPVGVEPNEAPIESARAPINPPHYDCPVRPSLPSDEPVAPPYDFIPSVIPSDVLISPQESPIIENPTSIPLNEIPVGCATSTSFMGYSTQLLAVSALLIFSFF